MSKQGEAAPAPTSGSQASTSPVTLKIFYFDASGNFKADLPIFKKAAEKTNVSLSNVAPTGGDEKQAYNLMLASGDIPDLISYKLGDLNAIAAQGALQPLNELIDKHAPNLKKFLEQRSDVRQAITSPDGKIYTVPFVADGKATTGWFIRKDWLDKLGLQAPKTVDEYYQVLKAFKEKDPNGNGKPDEVPYFNRYTDTGAYQLLPLWDAYHTLYIKDNKIVFGPYEEQYKTGIANIAKWYKEGLIDQEIYTRGGKTRDILLANNIGGSTHDWFASTSNYNTSLKKDVPDLNFIPVAPPASTSGKVVEPGLRAALSGNGWAISAKTKDPVMAIKYFDYWFTEEGRRLWNFGVEGQSYTMVNGKPTFTEQVLSQPNVLGHLQQVYGAQSSSMGVWQDFSYEEQWTNKIALAGIKEYQDNNYISSNYTLPTLTFTESEQKRINELKPSIDTYVTEVSQKWVMGGEGVDANFASYIDQLKKKNVDELLKTYQAAYDRYKSK
ncbi:type 2 periplasmic-binding domain-containing protein [Paenibacillus puerhi]|uniref:extracellular solute-binding protein n=1 Tax=Paenibacillus puerhi TaxID=2692622 RepID=UPI00135C8888|nr:extracellular solute-binding protein [Paenibacillus puerhi]